jgi:hypothetical protein
MFHLPRFQLAALVFILCCLLSTARILKEAPAPRPDSVAQRSDQRFAALKTALPAQGVVGYIGDSSTPADYYLTQYALVPLIVDRSPNHVLVVGNFLNSPPAAPSPLQLIKDFGDGVVLFANKDAQ